MKPQLWLIAGPNGAGKTTLVSRGPFKRMLAGCNFLNPDERTLQFLLAQNVENFADAAPELLKATFIRAADAVFDEAKTRLSRGESVGLETVLSTNKYGSLGELVRERNGFFGLIYVAVRSPDLSARRIARRVRAGGHDVPPEKLAERWKRSLEILPWFARRASRFWAYDNSEGTLAGGPPVLLAEGREGRVQINEPDAIPALTEVLRPLLPAPGGGPRGGS